MTGYLAAIFLATVCMLMLHVAEWRTASAMAALLHSGSKPVAEVRRLRRAIRAEALYYLLIFPYVYSTSTTPSGRLLALAVIYHWGGLAFGAGSGLFEKWAAGRGNSRIGTVLVVAVLDIAEMLLLG